MRSIVPPGTPYRFVNGRWEMDLGEYGRLLKRWKRVRDRQQILSAIVLGVGTILLLGAASMAIARSIMEYLVPW